MYKELVMMEFVRCNICSANVPAGNFCDQCGATLKINSQGNSDYTKEDATIKIIQVKDGNICITLRPDTVIGRKEGPYAQILNGLKYISGKHAYVSFDERQGWSITDLGSTNCTYVNDDRLTPNVAHKFNKGDILDLGTILFEVV